MTQSLVVGHETPVRLNVGVPDGIATFAQDAPESVERRINGAEQQYGFVAEPAARHRVPPIAQEMAEI